MTKNDGRSIVTAWDDPATQEFLRGKQVAARVLVVVVIVFVVLSITLEALHQREADRLAQHGVHTKGVIVWIADRSCNDPRGPVTIKAAVRFETAEGTGTHVFDTSCGRGLFKGALVPIDYDRHNTNDFAVDGKTSDNPLIGVFDVLGGAAAFASAILAVAFTLERMNRRRLLLETPWVPTTMLLVRPPPNPRRPRAVVPYVTVLDTPVGQRVFRCPIPPYWLSGGQPLQVLEVAGKSTRQRAIRRPGERRIIFVSSNMSSKETQAGWTAWQGVASGMRHRD